ncbi:MAG: cyclodeaminase/cyclohydrolase family protein [Acidaminobacteraceae bacterium]
MKLCETSCNEFVDLLASKKSVPGGGGAAALTGALGIALNSMVVNFSIGKKKFIDVKDKHEEILAKADKLQKRLMELIDEDAENFYPLSQAYGLPSTTDEEKAYKEEVLQSALKVACSGPVEMIECIYESILLHEELVDISSKIIISDVGVGVQCLRAALHSALLNVIINVNSIKDEEYTRKINKETSEMVEKGSKIADEVYAKVLKIMG